MKTGYSETSAIIFAVITARSSNPAFRCNFEQVDIDLVLGYLQLVDFGSTTDVSAYMHPLKRPGVCACICMFCSNKTTGGREVDGLEPYQG
jgi:hypothetical protein